jgi:hypothetical protein
MSKKYPTMKVSDEFAARMHANREAAKKVAIAAPFNALANQGSDYTQYCGPVPDQGTEGSCTAETTRNHVWWKQNRYGYKTIIDPAINAIYYFARQIYGDLSTDGGSTINDAYQGGITYGIISTLNDLYNTGTLYTQPPLADVVFKCTSKTQLATTTAAIRASLDSGEPVGISMAVMQTLFSPVNGVVDVGPICPNEGHGQFVCGYKTDPQYQYLYKIQGSWGTGYGLNGFIYITEAYLDQCLWEAFQLDIPKNENGPIPVTLTSLTVTPSLIKIAPLGSASIAVTANYSDGTKKDVSQSVSYTSSVTNLLTCKGNTIAALASSGPDQCFVNVAYQGISSTITVDVIPVVPPTPAPTPKYCIQVGNLTKAQADALMATIKAQGYSVTETQQA